MKIKQYAAQVKAAGEAAGLDAGQFEAIVAVFGNVDSYGDRIIPGAFKDTLAEWAAKGDPIPVLWSHRSQDPESHIGYVLEAEERPEGLWVKAQLDTEPGDDIAQKVYRLLKGRRVTQFSFAYDVQEAAEVIENGDYIFELRKLKLYEVGPTLIGANQETDLLGVKQFGSARPQIAAGDETISSSASVTGNSKATAGPPATDDPDGAKSEPASPATADLVSRIDLLDLELAINQ